MNETIRYYNEHAEAFIRETAQAETRVNVICRKPCTIRPIRETEYPLLTDFLYEAIFVPEGQTPPPRSILEHPMLKASIEGFSTSQHDKALVAEVDQKVVGIVWARITPDYGHIDDETPSLDISLYKEYRGRGIGTELIEGMLRLLRESGYRRVSLSAQKANRAVRLYERVGFTILEDRGEELIMVKEL